MPRGKKFITQQIIGKLSEAEVELAQRKTVIRRVSPSEPMLTVGVEPSDSGPRRIVG